MKRHPTSARQPAKVLWVSCVGEKGGAEAYMINLLRRMNRAEFVPAVALLRPGSLEAELNGLGIQTYVLPQHRMRNIFAVGKSIAALARILARENYSLIHGNGFRSHVYAGLAGVLSRRPCAWLVHTAEKPSLSGPLIHRIPAAHVIANCQRTADYFVARGHPTSLIWPSIDPDQLARRASREALREKYGLPPGARWISLGARLQRYKGQEYFLRALASLPESLRDVHGFVIGGALFGMEESFLSELKALAASLGIAERVRFTGFVSDEDLRGLVAESELLAHPALDEDFGMIVAEAQGLGRPALAFASVGPQAILADGETGRLIPIGDQARLNEALGQMLSSPEILAAWGAAGRSRAVRLFDAAESARQLERVYKSCLPPVVG